MKALWLYLILGMISIIPCFGQYYLPCQFESLPITLRTGYSSFREQQNIQPFLPRKNSPTKQAAQDDTIWRIKSYSYFENPEVHEHTGEPFKYRGTTYLLYTSEGMKIRVLQRDVRYDPYLEVDSVVAVCNQTYIEEGEDMDDTITYYKLKNNVFEPYARSSYNYHLYDSLMYSIKAEDWIGGKWVEYGTYYYHFLDTISWFSTKKETYKNGKLRSGDISTPEYDEEGRVIRVVKKVYDSDSQAYRLDVKREYLYDEAGVCREYSSWYFADGAYWPLNKVTDIEWYDWQGFGNGIPLWIGVIGVLRPDPYSSLMSYYRSWYYEDGRFHLGQERKIWWNIDGNNGAVDSIFEYFEPFDPPFCIVSNFHYYDDHGYTKEWGYAGWTNPDENGLQEIWQDNTRTYFYERTYHPRIDLWQREEGWVSEYVNGIFDTDMQGYSVVDEYIATNYNYVSVPELPLPLPAIQPLSIAPNPVSGVATIAAATEIKQLQIFDITGKLMKEQVVSADKVVFDTGNLPKGIYIVQALLKNGERQMGKLVVP